MPDTRANDTHDMQIVVFDLSGEHYALGIERINTIIRMQQITPVPGTPDCIEGIINLRGNILPVLDPRKLFGLSVAEPRRSSRIVVAESQGMSIGLIVDAVTETLRIPEADIEEPPPSASTSGLRYVTGIGKVGERLFIILDIDKLLQAEELESLSIAPAA